MCILIFFFAQNICFYSRNLEIDFDITVKIYKYISGIVIENRVEFSNEQLNPSDSAKG